MLRFSKFLIYIFYERQVSVTVNSRHFRKEKKIKFLLKLNKPKKYGFVFRNWIITKLINMDSGIFIIQSPLLFSLKCTSIDFLPAPLSVQMSLFNRV